MTRRAISQVDMPIVRMLADRTKVSMLISSKTCQWEIIRRIGPTITNSVWRQDPPAIESWKSICVLLGRKHTGELPLCPCDEVVPQLWHISSAAESDPHPRRESLHGKDRCELKARTLRFRAGRASVSEIRRGLTLLYQSPSPSTTTGLTNLTMCAPSNLPLQNEESSLAL